MSDDQDEIVECLARRVLPYEGGVRSWLRQANVGPGEIDDIIQEAYSRIAELETLSRVANPRAYFLQVARNILFDQLRRAQIVRIDTVAEVEALHLVDDRPSAERELIAKDELLRLKQLVDRLPERCRKIFVLRKIEGQSQKQIAATLGLAETTVETQIRRGLRLILDAWADDADDVPARRDMDHERRTRRRKPD